MSRAEVGQGPAAQWWDYRAAAPTPQRVKAAATLPMLNVKDTFQAKRR